MQLQFRATSEWTLLQPLSIWLEYSRIHIKTTSRACQSSYPWHWKWRKHIKPFTNCYTCSCYMIWHCSWVTLHWVGFSRGTMLLTSRMLQWEAIEMIKSKMHRQSVVQKSNVLNGHVVHELPNSSSHVLTLHRNCIAVYSMLHYILSRKTKCHVVVVRTLLALNKLYGVLQPFLEGLNICTLRPRAHGV